MARKRISEVTAEAVARGIITPMEALGIVAAVEFVGEYVQDDVTRPMREVGDDFRRDYGIFGRDSVRDLNAVPDEEDTRSECGCSSCDPYSALNN